MGKYCVNVGGKEETSTRGRLLQLLPKIEDADLRREIEETLKKGELVLKRFKDKSCKYCSNKNNIIYINTEKLTTITERGEVTSENTSDWK